MNQAFMEVNLFGDFATIILIHIDLNNRLITFANAGHDPAWLIGSGGEVTELLPTGTVLGIDGDSVWENQSRPLAGNARIAISTDGITETFDENERQFGKAQLIELLLKSKSMDALQAAEQIHENVVRFRGSRKQNDDVTLLILDLSPVEL